VEQDVVSCLYRIGPQALAYPEILIRRGPKKKLLHYFGDFLGDVVVTSLKWRHDWYF